MSDIITLKQLCLELKLDRREAREILRAAVKDTKNYPELFKSHKAKSAWQWNKASPAEKEARRALTA